MTYLVKVTYPWHQFPNTSRVVPKVFRAETPEEAALTFQEEAGPIRLDLSRAVEQLSNGRKLRHQDQETGRTVIAQVELTHEVEVTYEWDPDDRRDERFGPLTLQDAAGTFESESEPPRCELADFVNDLEEGKPLESFDDETGKRVVARELVGAVV